LSTNKNLSAAMLEIKTRTGFATRFPKQLKKLNALQDHTFTPTNFCSDKNREFTTELLIFLLENLVLQKNTFQKFLFS
jgi:hypothetical protein